MICSLPLRGTLMMLELTLLISFAISLGVTPFVIKLANRMGATDKPNYRKVHKAAIPSLGGISIFIAFIIGVMIIQPEESFHLAFILGAFIVFITGLLDDIYDLRPSYKLAGQLLAAFVVVYLGEIQVTFINLPFGNTLEFGILSIPITIIWIVGVTNAINLIDGLDGLAAGVSSIALICIAGMAFIMSDAYVLAIALLLLASTVGFLFFNFHPAKIFMGDTGALFLGYVIAVLSLLGFKNVTFISFIIPILILGVPISDTFFAIIRRLINKKPLSAPDKSHFHHCLLKLGFSHRQTVLIIYAISALFGLSAFIFSLTTVWGSILFITILVLLIELGAEKIGLINQQYKPLLRFVKGFNKNR